MGAPMFSEVLSYLSKLDGFAGSATAAAAGAALMKLGDFLLRRRQSFDAATNDRLREVNAANKVLVDSLFQQVKLLQEQVDRLQKTVDHCSAQHTAADRKVAQLESELETLRAGITRH